MLRAIGGILHPLWAENSLILSLTSAAQPNEVGLR